MYDNYFNQYYGKKLAYQTATTGSGYSIADRLNMYNQFVANHHHHYDHISETERTNMNRANSGKGFIQLQHESRTLPNKVYTDKAKPSIHEENQHNHQPIAKPQTKHHDIHLQKHIKPTLARQNALRLEMGLGPLRKPEPVVSKPIVSKPEVNVMKKPPSQQVSAY